MDWELPTESTVIQHPCSSRAPAAVWLVAEDVDGRDIQTDAD